MPKMIEHRIPSSDSHPYILTFGPDGALWFCDNGAGQIGRMDLSTTKFHAFPLPRRDCQPIGIVTGPDGHLWFTEYAGHRVGRITVDGEVTEFNLPTTSAGPAGIIDGGDGNVWFAETDVAQIASIFPRWNCVGGGDWNPAKIAPFGARSARSRDLVYTGGRQRDRVQGCGRRNFGDRNRIEKQSATSAHPSPERRSLVRSYGCERTCTHRRSEHANRAPRADPKREPAQRDDRGRR